MGALFNGGSRPGAVGLSCPPMRLGGLSLALAVFLAGCHKEPEKSAPEPEASTATTPAPEAEAPPGPYVLTPDKLDRFLKYQREMVNLYAQVLQNLTQLERRADAGSYGGNSGGLLAMHDSLGLIESQEQAEEQARRKSGLSAADVRAIQPMVAAVVAQRKYASVVNFDASIAQLQKMREQLPADQRGQLDQTLEGLERQKAQAESLPEARRKFGDANVSLLLSREKELLSTYDAWMQAMTRPR
jgi:hypothetical protein